MPDDTPNLDIRATLDSSGVVAGGQQAASAIQGIYGPLTQAEAAAKQFGVSLDVAQAALDKNKALAKAAEVNALALAMRQASAAMDENTSATVVNAETQETAAESAERLNAIMREHQQMFMRNAFYVHRLAEGFKDLSLGGRAAGQGLMDISESLQYMLGPEVAIYAAIAQVVTMLAIVVTSHHRRGEAATEAAKQEVDAAKASTEAFQAQVREYQTGTDAMVNAQEAVLKAQKFSTDEMSKQIGFAKEQADQDKQRALLILQQGYDTAMAMANTPEQKAAVQRTYEAGRADIEGNATVNMAQLNAQEAATKAQGDAQELAARKAQDAANRAKMDNARETMRKIEQRLAGGGFSYDADVDKEGKPTGAGTIREPLLPGQVEGKGADTLASIREEIDRRQREYSQAKAFAESEHAFPGSADAEAVTAAKQKLDGAQAALTSFTDDLQKLNDAFAILHDKDLQKSIEEGQGQIREMEVKAADSAQEANLKSSALDLAKRQDSEAATARAQKLKDDQDRADQETFHQAAQNEFKARILGAGKDKAKVDAIKKEQEADQTNWELYQQGGSAPYQARANAPQNPFNDQISALQRLLDPANPDSLVAQLNAISGPNFQGAAWDRARGALQGQIAGVNTKLSPSQNPNQQSLEDQWQTWENANAQNPNAAPTAQSLLIKSIRDLGEAQKKSVEATGKAADLVGSLADKTHASVDEIHSRLSRVEAKVNGNWKSGIPNN